MTVEYLAAGGIPRPRLRRGLAVLVVVAVCVAAAAAWGSGKVRDDANASLVAALTRTHHEATAGQAAVESTLSYTYPMIWSIMVPPEVRTDLRQLVQDSAAKVASSLTALRSTASATPVLPWQSDQRDARDAVIAVIDAQLDRFERIATDATAIGPVLARPAPSDAEAASLLRASGAEVPADR